MEERSQLPRPVNNQKGQEPRVSLPLGAQRATRERNLSPRKRKTVRSIVSVKEKQKSLSIGKRRMKAGGSKKSQKKGLGVRRERPRRLEKFDL